MWRGGKRLLVSVYAFVDVSATVHDRVVLSLVVVGADTG